MTAIVFKRMQGVVVDNGDRFGANVNRTGFFCCLAKSTLLTAVGSQYCNALVLGFDAQGLIVDENILCHANTIDSEAMFYQVTRNRGRKALLIELIDFQFFIFLSSTAS